MANSTIPERLRLHLLIIEDSEDDALLLLHNFRAAGYDCHHARVDNAAAMRNALAAESWDVVLSDHRMPNFSAIAALEILQQAGIDVPFVIVSGFIDEDTAIAAMRAGAHDYLSKDKLDRLLPAVERELREARIRRERRLALEAVRENEARYRALVANIPGMVFQMDLEHEDAPNFLYVSEGSSAVLGIRADDLVTGRVLLLDMIPEDDRSSFRATLGACAHDYSQINWDGRVLTRDGATKWINLRSSPRQLDSGGTIWEGIVSNITQSKEIEYELRQSREQLAELSSHLQVVKEQERERIARDIHDELGATLVAVKFEVALLAAKAPGDPLQLRKRVRGIEKLVDDAIATAGRVARELRPGILKDFGLAAAVECQAEDFSQRTGVACHVLCADHDIEPDPETSTALFRIFQETLTNVSKHANANCVEVRLTQEGGDIVLEVCDDGRGVDVADLAKPRSYGLRGIRERIHSLAGVLEITRRDPKGTRVCVRAPAGRVSPDLPEQSLQNAINAQPLR